jgi:hypothetical protein
VSAHDRYERLTPETASPEGVVHYEDFPIPVRYTYVLTRPTLSVDYDGLVLAWTQNAVLVFWVERTMEGRRPRTAWVKPERVTRKPAPGQ